MQKQIPNPLARIRDDSNSNGWLKTAATKATATEPAGRRRYKNEAKAAEASFALRESGGKPPHPKTGWAGGYDEGRAGAPRCDD